MKKLILFGTAFLFVGIINVNAQDWCGFDHHQQKFYDDNPGTEAEFEEINQQIIDGTIESNNDRVGPYTIPVVVHIIYTTPEGNISYDQVESMITALNEDFNALNSSLSSVRNTAEAPFTPVIGSLNATFALANIDPSGNCTNGVERRESGAGEGADDDVKFYGSGGLTQWNRNNYLNIWVVESIDLGGTGTTLGYGEFPMGGGSSTYGLVVRHDVTGTIGTSSSNRTVTHEIGHCLGLYHTFQGGCHSNNCNNNGDRCCDTPPLDDPHWSCSSTQNYCTSIPTNDTYGFDAYDQFENHMSYSSCRSMYTLDQVSRMEGMLDGITFLQNLTSTANATQTGIDGPGVICSAEFTSNIRVICAGESVDFTDMSYHNVTGRTWTFDGGSPGSSSVENPTVTYNTGGVYDVTLEVTDGSGTVTETETNYIIVIADPGVALPYTESFETLSTFPDDITFSVQNDDGGQTWNMNSSTASTGTKCVKLANFGVTNESNDAFVSGSIDLSTVDPTDNIIFSFKYAYKKRASTNNEALKLYVSKDCGETWALRKNLSNDNLNSLTQTSPYTPADETEWFEVEVLNINSLYFVSNFRFKFEFENNGGNNIYIDDINIYSGSMVGLEIESNPNAISVYPNPVNDLMEINLDLRESGDYSIQLVNALGEYVDNVFTGFVDSGNTTISYSANGLPSGVYFLMIESNGLIETKKIIKE